MLASLEKVGGGAMTRDEREVAIAAHCAAHDAKVARRVKQRHSRQDRNKRRGLAAFVARIEREALQ